MKCFKCNTDGADIYRNSLAIIHEEGDLSRLGADEKTIAVRMIHAAGRTNLAKDIVFLPEAVRAARQVLEDGAPILTDVNTIASGITRKRLPADNEVVCLLRDGHVPELAQELSTTRTTAAVELWKTRLEDAVAAIDDAPTALFHLLNHIDKGSFLVPAAILAMPIGFVGVAESKRTTIGSDAEDPGLKYIVVAGHRGGSAITYVALSVITTAKEIL